MEGKIEEIKVLLGKNLADWVRITQSEEILLGIEESELKKMFEHEDI